MAQPREERMIGSNFWKLYTAESIATLQAHVGCTSRIPIARLAFGEADREDGLHHSTKKRL